MSCVFLITLILLVNIMLCILVLLTVALTLVNVFGYIYFLHGTDHRHNLLHVHVSSWLSGCV
jgi:hypothetical protein